MYIHVPVLFLTTFSLEDLRLSGLMHIIHNHELFKLFRTLMYLPVHMMILNNHLAKHVGHIYYLEHNVW